jgi:UDP-N-acetylmuramoylalanine--D-glutamate ligase
MKLDFDYVIIFGMGTTGKSCLNFFNEYYKQKFNHQLEVICVDSDPLILDNLSFFDLRENTNDELYNDKLDPYLNDRTLIVWSPGISWENPLLKRCVELKLKIWSEIELASRFFKKPIMALTGTNGKTTTVSLIQHILEKCQQRSFLGGNIGLPFIEAVKNQDQYDLAILEISSFQLEAIESFHPNYAGILNLYKNHEERYNNFEDYVAAKCNILKNLTNKDIFYKRENEPALENVIEKRSKKILCKIKTIPNHLIKNTQFWGTLDANQLPLKGAHNLDNLALAKLFLNDWGIKDQEIELAMLDFKAISYRLEKIYENKNYFIFNDSKSTNWSATVIALRSFEQPPVLIMGGRLRNENELLEDQQLLQDISRLSKKIIAIGEAGSTIEDYFSNKCEVIVRKDLSEVFKYIKKYLITDDNELSEHILFSPGYPSFDCYKNYMERGQHFTELVGQLEATLK